MEGNHLVKNTRAATTICACELISLLQARVMISRYWLLNMRVYCSRAIMVKNVKVVLNYNLKIINIIVKIKKCHHSKQIKGQILKKIDETRWFSVFKNIIWRNADFLKMTCINTLPQLLAILCKEWKTKIVFSFPSPEIRSTKKLTCWKLTSHNAESCIFSWKKKYFCLKKRGIPFN